MSFVLVQLISLAMQEHKGQDVPLALVSGQLHSCKSAGLVMGAGREILITECDLLRDYLTAASPGPHCSWNKILGKKDTGQIYF